MELAFIWHLPQLPLPISFPQHYIYGDTTDTTLREWNGLWNNFMGKPQRDERRERGK